jgi:two-component system chemotaxis response regulator CheB
MATRDLVVIGASAGGIEALKTLCAALPSDLPSSLLIVLHAGQASPNNLDRILSRAGPLPASNAVDGDAIRPGHIHVASSGFHLLVDPPGVLRLTRGPRENRFRPAIDVLFRSAALGFGPRVVGVVLSGHLDDGTAGLRAIKSRGGIALVQDPREALAKGMPRSALRYVEVDACLPAAALASVIAEQSRTPVERSEGGPMPEPMKSEVDIAREINPLETSFLAFARPSVYACPECHGVLMEVEDGDDTRFRCHTGHAYSLLSLLDESRQRAETDLWNAVRSLEETVFMLRDLAAKLRQKGEPGDRFLAQADEAQRRADVVRAALMKTSADTATADVAAGG